MANFLIIRDLCEKKKITIRELAAKVGMQDISIHQLIKKGKTNTETLEKIAEILDVPVGIFFDDTPLGNNIIQRENDHVTGKGEKRKVSVMIPQEILEQISHLTQTVLSQQQTIDYLCKKITGDIVVAV
jgi:transcriptional regulator with XRE-family HTH domain